MLNAGQFYLWAASGQKVRNCAAAEPKQQSAAGALGRQEQPPVAAIGPRLGLSATDWVPGGITGLINGVVVDWRYRNRLHDSIHLECDAGV
jgi:hypothetical protein